MPTIDRAVIWANGFNDLQAPDLKTRQQAVLKAKMEASESDDSLLIMYTDFLESVLKFYKTLNVNDTKDNALDRLKILYRHVFNENEHITNPNTKHLETSDHYIPDYKVSYRGNLIKLFDVLIVECKLNEKSFFPHKNDYLELQLEMQIILNELIINNVDDHVSFDLLVKGLKCKMYMMWLQHDGQYICHEAQPFSLSDSTDQTLLCPSILSVFLALKEKIDALIERIHNRKKGKSNLLSYIRKGFDIPIIISDSFLHDTLSDTISA
ncbi:hypothetical protein G6F43_010122 [Rhizopus delemar]|nr:hypothetical protein G6F43_010122 [Rhizopus delemar]